LTSGPDGRPLASIRLANLRDGFEDYEYFRLLKNLKGDARIPPEVVASPTEYSADPGLFYKTRAAVASEIESLSGSPEGQARLEACRLPFLTLH